ncbi:hypothetical protein [Streptomyces sp. NPDC004728]|uniref:hypothetical protein n=1 Tax=Streptomyces sp. NPDC004728 TaxID=3154289 RepID=UPI0033B539A8
MYTISRTRAARQTEICPLRGQALIAGAEYEPSVRQATGWLTRQLATLTEEEKIQRKAVLDHIPELASATELTSAFAEMLTSTACACANGSPRR